MRVRRQRTDRWRLLLLLDVVLQLDAVHRRGHEIRRVAAAAGRRVLVGGFWYVVWQLLLRRDWLLVMLHLLLLLLVDGIETLIVTVWR